jgi:hypothetical protein
MMNERIKQLAEQAGMIIDKYGLARDASTGLEDGVDIYKFAELIVRECGIALKPMLRDMISRGQAHDLIKKHFGVK